MIPILYEKTETAFTSNGICRLPDMISGTATEERNGMFVVEFEYPVDGENYSEIQIGRIIFCSCSWGNEQPFEIYESSKPINGRVIFTARHLTYRGNFIPIEPFIIENATATEALNAFKNHVMSPCTCPFTLESTISGTHTFIVDMPSAFRSRLGGVEGSILDVYGGEYEWGYDFINQQPKIKLWAHRGSNRGVTVKYGKNLTDLQQEESIENMITGVVMYYLAEDGYECSDVTIASGAGSAYTTYPRIAMLDVTESYEAVPPKATLNARAESYLNTHDMGVPKISLEVSFVNLVDTEEYKDIAALERVELCDTVTIEFDKLGVSATAKVVKTEWDILRDKYVSIELGNSRTNISSVVVEQEDVIREVAQNSPSLVDVQTVIDRTTRRITGVSGGYVVFRDSDNDGKPDEILIMNTDNINTATKVWRWNQGGLGYSSHGYNPSAFDVAITQDGEIYANFITAGELNGAVIKGNSIETTKLSVTAQRTLSQDEQYIYYANSANSAPTAPTAWVTDVTGGNAKWTAKRPPYSRSYPYCFSAKQRKDAVDAVTTTTPMLDETTTVIDGANIITGSITANSIGAGQITASKLSVDALEVGGIPLAGNKLIYTLTRLHANVSVVYSMIYEFPNIVSGYIYFSVTGNIPADTEILGNFPSIPFWGKHAIVLSLVGDTAENRTSRCTIAQDQTQTDMRLRLIDAIGKSGSTMWFYLSFTTPRDW